ncbi:MAG: septum formation family protein [Propionibacteriaceae bacterium]|jgi:hypothetical protein|nr:septum formation family protein [Propionibacteriaceae bacterium]
MYIRQTLTKVMAGLGALALAGSLGACSLFQKDDADRDPEGNVTQAGEVNVFSIKVGDCLDLASFGGASDDTVESMGVVPCGDPHDGEVIKEITLTELDQYDEYTVQELASDACYDAMDEIVGGDDWAGLSYTTLYPTSGSWADGDRLVDCIAAADEPTLTSSVVGLGLNS